ncbi:cbp/p300-interacting transactivator 2 [Aplochiton taeniatus]
MEMHQGGFPGAVSSIPQHPHPGTGHCRLGMTGSFSSPQQHHNQYHGLIGEQLHFGGTSGTLSHGVRHLVGPAGNVGVNGDGMLSFPTATGRYTSTLYAVGSAGFPSPASQGQLAASLQLQKLNTQYYSQQAHHPHPATTPSAASSSTGHHFCLQQQQQLPGDGTGQLGGSKVNTGHHQVSVALAPPANVMDTDLVDEEVLMALVLEMGLDRVKELPELCLGQNECDFMTEFVYKQQQPSRISC